MLKTINIIMLYTMVFKFVIKNSYVKKVNSKVCLKKFTLQLHFTNLKLVLKQNL